MVSTGTKVPCTYESLAFNFDISLSGDKGTIKVQVIINLLFPSSMRISNQSIVNHNYIENGDLVSTVDFRVQSAVSILGKVKSR